MKGFIEVVSVSGEKTLVSVLNISSMNKSAFDDGALIWMVGGQTVETRETYEEVKALIEGAFMPTGVDSAVEKAKK